MKARQKHDFLSHEKKKKRSSRVTTRDGCTIPFKGHGGKTNNESRAVLPPLQKEEKKASESSRGSVGFFVIFPLNKSAGRESGETTFHTAGLAPGPRPRKEMYY